VQRIPDRGRAVRRVVVRTLKLLFWGILLQGYLLCTLLDARALRFWQVSTLYLVLVRQIKAD
jgi:hypothetical protein